MKRYLSLSLFLFVACGPSPTVSPTPSATPSPVPSATPQPSLTPPSSSAQPTPVPSPTPSAVASATPTPLPTLTPLPSPSLTPTPTQAATLRVKVYDDTGALRTAAQVRVRSNSPDVVYDKVMPLVSSEFKLEDIPLGVILEVSATDSGFTTRTTYVSLNAGNNRLLEFKGARLELSNRPEVVAISPANRPLNPYEPLRITFSEGMNEDSVVNSFAIQAEDQSSAFLAGGAVPYSSSFFANPDTVVYDSGQFNITWDDARTAVFTPKISWPATTGRNFRIVFNYQVTPGVGGVIRDRSGTEARTPLIEQLNEDEDGNEIRTSDGPVFLKNINEPYIPITIEGGFRSSGSIRNVTLNALSNSLRARFTEPLYITLPNGQNLPADEGSSGALNINAYRLTCNGIQVAMPPSALVSYLGDDEVELRALSTEPLFSSGDQCVISIDGIRGVTGQSFRRYDTTQNVL
jgi:hypothetical protein